MARIRTALIAAFSLALAIPAMGQDKKDEALDRLLKELENKPAPSDESAPKPKKDDAKKDAAKEKEAAKTADKSKAKAKAKPADEPKDKALDSFLEKLGETKEAPKTTGPAGGSSEKEGDKPLPGKQPEDKTAGMIKAGEKPLDEHLEELTGRVRKKKNGQQGQQQGQQGQQGQDDDGSDENTPVGRAVKKMRQVQTKLGEDDTGEETRKTQGEIVKDLDQMISQAKRSAQMQMRMRQQRQGKQQPGQQQEGEQPGSQGNTAQGAKPMKPVDPKNTAALVGDKNTWGNLPAYIREEMENVFKAEPLPAKADRIGKYYKAVAKKGMSSPRG